MFMRDCIFCKIIAGELPSYKIYEDDNYLAFLDLYPLTEGHTMVIPKEHYEWVWDSSDLGGYFEVVGKVARHFREVTGEGVRSNIYGWEVPHAHIHIKPRQKNNMDASKLSDEKLSKIRDKYKLSS